MRAGEDPLRLEANVRNGSVMMYEGKVLDGRNRVRACEEIGIQPDLEYFNGDDPV